MTPQSLKLLIYLMEVDDNGVSYLWHENDYLKYYESLIEHGLVARRNDGDSDIVVSITPLGLKVANYHRLRI